MGTMMMPLAIAALAFLLGAQVAAIIIAGVLAATTKCEPPRIVVKAGLFPSYAAFKEKVSP